MITKLLRYADAEDWIYKSYFRAKPFIGKENDSITRNPGLTRLLLSALHNPDYGNRTILITGSKGKGSTSHLISLLLRGLGFKVGLFTSPHLVHFTERIRVNGQAIDPADFLRLCQKIEPFVEEIEAGLKPHEYQGPIGLALSVAMLYFQEQEVDYTVIEAGRGGRFDDTNVLSNQWAVISSIFPEHVDVLGPTIEDIIWHKVGIIKEETKAVIFNKQEDHVLDQIQRLLPQDKNAFYYSEQFEAKKIELHKRGTMFDIHTDQATYNGLELPLLGSFQAQNTATAVKACEVILGKHLPNQVVQEVLSNARWPGRSEIISQNPTVMVDGAINAASAEYIEEIVRKVGFRQVVSIVGVPLDKDYEGVIRVASRFSTQIILSAPDESHKSFPDNVLEVAKKYHKDCLEISPLREALEFAKGQKEIDLILIIGTQTLIGNAKRLYGQVLFQL